MVLYPHTRVFVGSSRTVDIAGPHIQVLDTTTGDVLHSTANFTEERLEAVMKSGPVRCAAVDREYRFLITSSEDKMLKLWKLDGLEIVNERELPKKPTVVAFTADAQTVLVSDKFGDVFSYPFVYTPRDSKDKDSEKQNSRDALASHENPSNGQLILGHASPLNAFLLTPDEKYIVTADRDEHVRVSWFPKGYNIEMYCLGHLKFVSAIHVSPSSPSSLISGGGDPMLKIWDWMTGAVKHELPVLDAVEPFIAVRALKRKRGSGDDGDEAAPQGKPKPKRKRGRKGGKGKEAELEQGEGEGEEGTATPTGAEADSAEQQKEEDEKPEKVLVIHRIESVESEAGPYIVFSAVGATALFAFPYTTDVSAGDIRHFDFGVPVLDFSVVDGRTVVANLDGQWTPEGSSEISAVEKDNEAGATSMVKVLTVSKGRLIEDSKTLKPLVDSLNSRSLLSSTPESLKKLTLYADLVSLPKVDPTDGDEGADQDGSTLPIGAPELSSSEAAKAKGKSKTELSKKELGRIKTKEAVRAFAMEIEAGGDKDKVRKGPEDVEDVDVPEAKRARSDVGLASAEGGNGEDVNMADS